MRRTSIAMLAAFTMLTSGALAADKPSGQPTPTEAPFVKSVSADLPARFATIDAAMAAGYIRFTNEDDTGAISYANRQWTSADPQHPSQLWYDVKGRLLGADFSVLQADSPQAPSLWGILPSRWGTHRAHVHYGLVGPNGTTIYGGVGASKLSPDDLAHPTAAALVAAGIAKSAKDVRFVFPFPAIWDLTVWVLPNSNGAFADANPDVTPAHNSQNSMDMGH